MTEASKPETPTRVGLSEGLGLAPEHAKPRAWAIFVDNGNARMWSTLQPHVQKLADSEGLEVTPLYDRAALDAAVAAERERIKARLLGMDDAAAGWHNYYAHAAWVLFERA
jgi:hypothetical protein